MQVVHPALSLWLNSIAMSSFTGASALEIISLICFLFSLVFLIKSPELSVIPYFVSSV